MYNLKLDVSLLKNSFDWQDLTLPFVPHGYWTDSWMEQFWQVHFLQKEKAKRASQDSMGLNSKDIYNINSTKPVLKNVVYEPADLNKIVSSLNYLLADEKPLLLDTLSKYPSIFEFWNMGSGKEKNYPSDSSQEASLIMHKHIQYHSHNKKQPRQQSNANATLELYDY